MHLSVVSELAAPRPGRRRFVAARASLACAIVILALGLADEARAAGIIDLGAIVPMALNSSDQVVGDALDSSGTTSTNQAELWTGGTLTALPAQAGADSSDAYAINGSGRIVGDDHFSDGSVHAVFWDPGTGPTQIGPLGGTSLDFSQATAVDTVGDVVGRTTSGTKFVGFLLHGGVLKAAGSADAGPSNSSLVGAITSAGDTLLGEVTSTSTYYLWGGTAPSAPGVALDITPPRGGAGPFLTGTTYGPLIQNDLSSDGTVLGFKGSGTNRAFWIRLASGAEQAVTGLAAANGVNVQHVVAGTILTGNPADPVHAAIWTPGLGVTDLNTLIPASAGFDLFDALAINDHGGIAGIAAHNGVETGFLLPSLPDIQAESVEISQGVQRATWSTPTTVTAPGFGAVAGGAYTGVPLVSDVPTVVRVYASVSAARGNALPQTGVTVELHAYRGSSGALSELAGSPLSATPRTLAAGNSLPAARTVSNGAYTFTLPTAWTSGGPLTLVADVNPAVAGKRPIAECAGCTSNDESVLSRIDFTSTQTVTLRPFEIKWKYPNASGHGFTTMTGPNLSSLFNPARTLLPLAPGNLVVQPYPQAVLDLSAQVQHLVRFWRATNHIDLTNPDLSDCYAIPLCQADLTGYEFDAVRRFITLSHGNRTYLMGFEPLPAGLTWPTQGLSIIGPHTPSRPLTSAAHELLHLLGFEHASTACGGGAGGQVGVSWPPDQRGYIQGVGLDRTPNSGGQGAYRIVAPGVGQAQWYDFMSYCTGGDDAVAWISTINWTKFVGIDAAAAADVAAAAVTRVAARAGSTTAGGRMLVDVSLAPGATARVLGASSTTAPATRSVRSTFRLVALGPHRRVLANIGLDPQHVNESAVLMFSAVVRAAGATMLAFKEGGHVVATLRRPSPAPSVRLALPRRGFKPSHGRLQIRWRSHGARGITLTTTVQYLASARLGWQTVAAGVPGTKYEIPISELGHSRRIRIRVLVNDGFSTATATSPEIKLR